MDATPDYLLYPEVAERIHSYNPGMRAVFAFRNPISRAFSQWNMCKRLVETRNPALANQMKLSDEAMRRCVLPFIGSGRWPSFESMVDRELALLESGECKREPFPDFIRRGMYASQLKNWYRFFPRHQVELVSFDDFKAQPLVVLNRIASFLQIEDFRPHYVDRNANPERYAGRIDERVWDRLREFYVSEMVEFNKLTGIHWTTWTEEGSPENPPPSPAPASANHLHARS